ncbi:MAG: hypothetical protein ACREBC_13350 [Pyrinomonadaceae bacterium]
MSKERLPLPGQIVGYAFAVVIVAVAARVVYEALEPMLPLLGTVVDATSPKQ